MNNEKLYLLYQFTVPTGLLKEVKTAFAEAIPLALKEPGCEAMYTTSVDGEPNKLVFFEIFSSDDAHKFHMEQAYTKKLFAAVEGKVAGPPVVRLKALYGRGLPSHTKALETVDRREALGSVTQMRSQRTQTEEGKHNARR